MEVHKIHTILKRVGLSENEAKSYIELIARGPLTIQELAVRTGIHRVNIYAVIQGLESKGAISFEIRSKYRKKVIPNHPRQLLELVRQKERELKKAELKLKSVVPELAGFLKQSKESTSMRYFEGLEGVTRVVQDIFSATTELKGFSNVEILNDYIPNETMNELRRQKSDIGLEGKFIVPGGRISKTYIQKFYIERGLKHYPEIRIISTNLFNVLAEMDVYDEKLAMLSLSREEQFGVIIESKILSRSFVSIFDTLWEQAKPV